MITFLRKSGLYLARLFLGMLALLFVLLIVIQAGLTIGINLISSGKGSDFLTDYINKALAPSEYHIELRHLGYDPVRGLSLQDLVVADTEGPFATLDHFSLSPSFVLSPLRTLELTAQGGTLVLTRLPAASEEPQPPETVTGFEMPDIYFRRITLSRLSFDQVIIGEEVAGTSYILSPTLRAKADLTRGIQLSARLQSEMNEIVPGLAAPEHINLIASFAPENLAFNLEDMSLTAPGYTFQAQGTGTLDDEGTLHLRAQAQHDDLTILTGQSFQRAQAQLTIDGPLSGPGLDLTALIVPASLKERGLSDIMISLKTDDVAQGMRGIMRVETTFQEEPVTLESQIAYEAPLLQLGNIQGSAPALSLSGQGDFSTDTNLFDGALSVEANDLNHYSRLAGMALGGRVKAAATLSPSEEGQQAASFTVNVANGVFDSVTVKTLSAQAELNSLVTPWPQSATLTASSLRLAEADLSLDTVNGSITAAGENIYTLSVNGKGRRPVALSFDGTAALSDLTQTIPTARDIAFSLNHGASSIAIGGDISREQVALTLNGKNIRGVDIPASLPEQLDDMRLTINASMRGPLDKPLSDITASLTNLGVGEYQNAALSLSAHHDGERVSAELSGQGTGIRAFTAEAGFPMALSLYPFQFSLDQSAPLSGSLKANIDLAAITPLFLSPTQSFTGLMTAEGTLSGTLSSPVPTGTLRLSDAAFNDDGAGLHLSDLSASASVDQNSLTLTSLSATDGKEGTLNGSGSLVFASRASDISLNLQNFNIPNSDLADGMISADLSLQGSNEGMNLAGTANIAEMHVLIPETFSSSIPQLNIIEEESEAGPSLLDQLSLDIKIDARNQVFVRGWGLDAEFGGNIDISGAASAPQFNGTLSSLRGRYEEFGKRFTLSKANLRFQGDVPPSPYLDIEATTPAGDVTGAINLTGPVNDPSISFSSTPSLPEDEVLSRILFGKDSAKISPFQAIQLAQTIRRFSGEGGGLDPLGMLRDATGLDDISVETDETGAANVGVGKYLTDDVYLELGTGKAENSGEATIQIEVTPSINVESRIGQDAQGGGGIFWKHDY